jgi:hypothetical protein
MNRTVTSWQSLFVGCALVAVAVTGTAMADQDGDQGKGKRKKVEAGTGKIIQLDASKLPPDLLKQLMKYAAEGQKKGGPKMAAKDKGKMTLPPGLANKAADHPGRLNWLREHGYREPATGKDKKKGGDGFQKKGGPKMAAKDKGKMTLPPGLANKAADHPGRLNWLRETATRNQPRAEARRVVTAK